MAKAKKKEAKKGKKKGNVVSVDFSGMKSYKRPPEGSYVLKTIAAEESESSAGNPTIKLELEIASGNYEGSKFWITAPMWKFREYLEASGQEIEDKMDVDLDDLVGVEVGATVLHETYEGNKRAKIDDFISAEDVEENDEEETEEADEEDDEDDSKSSKGKASKKEKKSSKKEVDVSEMDEDELAEVIEEKGLDVDLEDYSSIKKQRAAVKEALEGDNSDDDDDDDSDDEEEDEDQEKYTEDQINEMKTKELSSLNDDLELGIEDLDDMKAKQARRAVIKALKKKKLLED